MLVKVILPISDISIASFHRLLAEKRTVWNEDTVTLAPQGFENIVRVSPLLHFTLMITYTDWRYHRQEI